NRCLTFKLWSRQHHQLLAASYLVTGNRNAAQPHLAALKDKRQWISVVAKTDVANRLFARGAYDDFLSYDAAVRERDTDELRLYRAAAQLALGNVADAEATMKTIDRDDVDAKRVEAFDRALADRRTG